MPPYTIDEGAPVLVEFDLAPGAREVSRSPEKLAEKSAEALNSAMETVYGVTQHVMATVGALPHRPQEIQVSFGIKVNTEAGAFIAKVGGEATFNVSLTLGQDNTSNEQ